MRRLALVTIFFCAGAALMFTARGQQPAPGKGQTKAAKDVPEDHRPPLFFREPWRHPPGPPEHPITQDSVSNPNLELKLYGDQPRPDPDYGGIWENRRDSPKDDPVHIYTGT